MPSINVLHEEWSPRGLTVLLVNLSEDRRKVADIVAERRYTAPVVLDADGQVANAYGVTATPTVFVIGGDGAILGRVIGPRPWTERPGRALLQALLQASPSGRP